MRFIAPLSRTAHFPVASRALVVCDSKVDAVRDRGFHCQHLFADHPAKSLAEPVFHSADFGGVDLTHELGSLVCSCILKAGKSFLL